MTIVGPDTVTMTKSGPANMTLAVPATFSLDVQNTGTGPAWNLTLLDVLQDLPTAGVCDTPPTNFTAQVFESNGTTTVSAPLVLGTDFSVAARGAPDCDFTVQMLTPATTVGATQRLIVDYDVVLDTDSQNGDTDKYEGECRSAIPVLPRDGRSRGDLNGSRRWQWRGRDWMWYGDGSGRRRWRQPLLKLRVIRLLLRWRQQADAGGRDLVE